MVEKPGKIVLITTLVLLTSSVATAATGASINSGNGNATADTGGGDTVTTQAGAVSNINVSSDQNTNKWSGFYGNISGQKVLGDGSNNFYSWTADNFNGAKVITVPSGDSIPSSITGITDPSTILGSEFDTGSDNSTNTFDTTGTVNYDGTDVTTSKVDTFNSGGSGTYPTFLAENGNQAGQPVYVAESLTGATSFNNKNFNYQMLVGVGESSSQKAFDFYLELP